MAKNDTTESAAPPAPNTVETQKLSENKATADRLAAAPAPAEPAPDAPRNLTRESIEEKLVSDFIAAGKSPEEAAVLGKKRALEMISADAK